MTLYYLLLLLARFHANPWVGASLFRAGFLMVTPVKIVGGLAIVAALILPRPDDAAPHKSSPISGMFFLFPVMPILVAAAYGFRIPDEWTSHVVSFALMLIATRALVCDASRMRTAVRVVVFVQILSTYWIFKQHFIQGQDRVTGVEGDPNYEALSLVIALPLAVWLARHEARAFLKRIWVLCLPVMVYAIVLTQSRGGLLALAVMAAGSFIRSSHKLGIVAAVMLLLPLAVLVSPQGLTSRLVSTRVSGVPSNSDEESSRVHFELIRAGLRMTADNALLGVGVGRFPEEVENYNRELINLTGRPFIAHNTYLEISAETGLLELALWIAIVAAALVNCRVARKAAPSDVDEFAELAVAIQFAIIAYSFVVLFLTAEWVVPFWLIVFLSQNLKEITLARRMSLFASREPTFQRLEAPKSLCAA